MDDSKSEQPNRRDRQTQTCPQSDYKEHDNRDEDYVVELVEQNERPRRKIYF